MNIRWYIACPKIYLSIYITWNDDVISRDNYIMMSNSRYLQSAILDFKKFQKRQKTALNYWKVLKIDKTVQNT